MEGIRVSDIFVRILGNKNGRVIMKKICFCLSMFISFSVNADLIPGEQVFPHLNDGGFLKVAPIRCPVVSNPSNSEYTLLKKYMEELGSEPTAQALYDAACKISIECCFSQAGRIAANLLARSLQKGLVSGAAASLIEMGLLSHFVDQVALTKAGVTFSEIAPILEIMLRALDYGNGHAQTRCLVDEGNEFGDYPYKGAVLAVKDHVRTLVQVLSGDSHSNLTLIVESSIAITLALRALATTVITSQLITEQLRKIVKEKNLMKIASALVTQSFINALIAIIETGHNDRFAPFKI
jgi:hypothetical protein